MTLPSDPRGFLYRDTLDPGTAIKLTAEALGQAEDGELYLQYRKTEAFGFDDGRLKTASYDTQSGFGLRAVSGETTAFAHANEITPQAIRRAAETMALIRSRDRPQRRAASQEQPPSLHRPGPARPRPLRRQGEPLPDDRRRRPRARPPRRPGLGRAHRPVERRRDRPPRRLRRHRRAPARPPQRRDRGRGERPPRDRQLRDGRTDALRPSVRARHLEPRGRRSAQAGAGQPRRRRRPRRRDDRAVRPRLARRAAPRGGRPRARGRFQPQGHQRLLGADRRARRRGGGHGGRRRIDRPAARLAVDRRRRHADPGEHPDRGWRAQGLSPGSAQCPA